jgi:hypothetical protein
MASREDLLADLLADEQVRSGFDKGASRTGRLTRSHRSFPGRAVATLAMVGLSVLAPAALSLPGAGASAATDCWHPDFVPRDHVKWCSGTAGGHISYDYTGSYIYLGGGYWHTCYKFTYYRWGLGCQYVDGPYSTQRCN